jgi:XTP/dITP diphosphohydrolase
MKICLATENKGKVMEMKALLSALPFSIVISRDLGIEMDVAETGSSYRENAYLKASAYAARTGLLCLGDDSGLEVAALNGAPGLFSNRFAPIEKPTDQDRRKYLLSKLVDQPHPWKAFFICTLCLCKPDGRHWYFTGRCDGEIIPEERGNNGFGYDPIFLMDGSDRTMAELDDHEKNVISHRARAVQNAMPQLDDLITQR